MTAPRVRPFAAPDVAPCVAVSAAVDPAHRLSVDEWQQRDARRDTTRHHLIRFVAESSGQVAGWGQVAHTPWQFHPRKYALRLEVAPEHRRRGLGSALLERLLIELRRRDPLLLRAVATAGEAAGLDFLTHRGFREVWRMLPSRLDVAEFDAAPFAGAAERVGRQGVTITTLAAVVARDAGVLREVYDLYVTCNRGQQQLDPVTFPPFEAFVASEVQGPGAIGGELGAAWFLALQGRHDGVRRLPPSGRARGNESASHKTPTRTSEWCGADSLGMPHGVGGDGRRIVGVSTLERVAGAPGVVEPGYTAVLPAYRRRGIALALKLRAIEYAREHGYGHIETSSNAVNLPMLNLNAALGFRPLPAQITLERSLS